MVTHIMTQQVTLFTCDQQRWAKVLHCDSLGQGGSQENCTVVSLV